MCSSEIELNRVKERKTSQKNLQEVSSFKTLKTKTRIPNKYKKLIRNSKKTSFIYPNNKSFRVVDKNSKHYNFINKVKSIYSSSANLTNHSYSYEFASSVSNIEIVSNENYIENSSSSIFKVTNKKIKKIR